MKAELIAHFCLTYPPYRTARPGMLCMPTNVAAANCHALLPLSSHLGDGTSIYFSPAFFRTRQKYTTSGPQRRGRMSGSSGVEARAMPAARLKGIASETRFWREPSTRTAYKLGKIDRPPL